MVIAIIGILVALLLPAIQAAREAARRSQCQNNLKNIGIAALNHHDGKKSFPPGSVMSGFSGIGSLSYHEGWTHEIMPYAEDESLRGLYDESLAIYLTGNSQQAIQAKQYREMPVPLYTCPSDLPMELTIPASGPASDQSIQFMTGSYRGNAGRGDGIITWYLYEGVPMPGRLTATGAHFGWRGPLHASLPPKATSPTNMGVLTTESIKNITDGTSKTMLAGESTNIDPDPDGNPNRSRRTFWAYTWGNYLLSQPTPQPRTLLGHYDECTASGIETTTPNTPTTGEAYRACMSAWYSLHPSGMNAVLCDGSVTFLSFDIDLNVFASLGSIAAEDSETPIIGPRGGRG